LSRLRLATIDDVPSILAISNYYVRHSAANFAIEPESLDDWRRSYRETSETYPWFVAVDDAIGLRTLTVDGRLEGASDPKSPHPRPLSRGERGEGRDTSRGSIVGFAKASPWKGRCAYAYSVEITVYIHPDAHRRGIGRLLYERLLATLKAQGYRTAFGGIALPNEASVGLHQSFGMTCIGVFRRVGWKFDRWHDVGYWQAVLNDDPDAVPQKVRPVREVVANDAQAL
jgi:L-amino acid N-acyltransferase YncA